MFGFHSKFLKVRAKIKTNGEKSISYSYLQVQCSLDAFQLSKVPLGILHIVIAVIEFFPSQLAHPQPIVLLNIIPG